MSRWQFAILLLFSLLAVQNSLHAEPMATAAVYECNWAESAITLDGQADEKNWQHAQVIDHFYLPGLPGQLAKQTSQARLLWDREFLYFFAEMNDADLRAVTVENAEKPVEDDALELFFKPVAEKTGYFAWRMNAAGLAQDTFFAKRDDKGSPRLKQEGDFHWEMKIAMRGTLNQSDDEDKGWSVEGRIPWLKFGRTGGRPNVNEAWQFAIGRSNYAAGQKEPELSASVPVSSTNFHEQEVYATIKFLGAKAEQAEKPFGIAKHIPLTTSTVIGSPDPPLPYRAKRVYPKLKLNYPITIMRQPKSDRLLLITQPYPFGPAKLFRFRDAPEASELEEIMGFGKNGIGFGLAFHPRFAENGYLYIGLNSGEEKKPKQTRVVRYTINREPPYAFDVQSAREIIAWDSDGHNGGDLAFGHDGLLYITSGDGTGDSDGNLAGQDLSKLTAKVLRIDVDHPQDEQAYSVPLDNPFVGQENVRPETWAYGLRNPWRITVDEKTGHVWVGNNGQDLWEQVYFVRRGDNFGWSVYEGSHPFYVNRKMGPHPLTLPVAEHHHIESRSLTGGVVYHGEKLPELRGAYIYGDHATGRIWCVRHDGKQAFGHRLLADTSFNITGFGIDHAGELLLLDHRGQNEGGIYQLEPTPPVTEPSRFPRKLSESGLFESVREHRMQSGVIPYSVNSPLWSDGAYKERFLALPQKPDQESRIGFTTQGGWNFPDETVAVKSFALEMEEGNPFSRRWVETRFFTRQSGEWAGDSYLWNEDETDAELVPAEGADREIKIRSAKSPTGFKTQVWHYPSRTECMVCHSRAANWVLGLSTLQMNKNHIYGGVVDNQLRVFENLGLFSVDWVREAQPKLREELKAHGLNDKEQAQRYGEITVGLDQSPQKPSYLLVQSPEKYSHLLNPYDKAKGSLAERARSYLHVNCASCHIFAGGGNSQIELNFTTSLDKTRLVDVPPSHHKYDLPDARLIAPGAPERSVLLYRLSKRGAGQMPQLATNVVDQEAVELIRAWILGMKPETISLDTK